MDGMEIDKLGIKFLVADPASVSLKSLVPVFHTWIQKQSVAGHLLIDVHDYSHIHNGPGILLVAHEGNFSMDMAGGRPGLLYYRKQPLGGTAEDRLAAILKSTLEGCSLLEHEPSVEGKIRFHTGELFVFANDRLHAPNDEKTLSELGGVVSAVFTRLLEGREFTLTPISENPKERFAVRVHTKSPVEIKTLLDRIPLVWSEYYSGGL